ncbi:MAG: prephenate dehydratase [Promethearchaeota archaeon]
MERIEKLRRRIDEIDEELVRLINERARVASEIGDVKQQLGVGVVDPSREEEVLAHVRSATDLVPSRDVVAVWREIMAVCKDVQGKVVRIGFLGPRGSFTDVAAHAYFPTAGSEFVPCDDVHDVFKRLEGDAVEFGVVPIENSLQGSVRETMDLLIEKNVKIYGEVQIRVVHDLIGVAGDEPLAERLRGVTRVYSHDQALRQCQAWLRKNLPGAELHETRSTADAVRKVVEGGAPGSVAIGTRLAAELYGGRVLVESIEDNPNNYTRFLVISKKDNLPTGRDKTSIIFVTKHVPGALYGVLKIFADLRINLLKIESRPQKQGVWEYIFWMDFAGHVSDPNVAKALEETRKLTVWEKVLGSYPVARETFK